jgi:hypothetical protein
MLTQEKKVRRLLSIGRSVEMEVGNGYRHIRTGDRVRIDAIEPTTVQHGRLLAAEVGGAVILGTFQGYDWTDLPRMMLKTRDGLQFIQWDDILGAATPTVRPGWASSGIRPRGATRCAPIAER